MIMERERETQKEAVSLELIQFFLNLYTKFYTLDENNPKVALLLSFHWILQTSPTGL